jgi:hypothetical protein
MNTNLLDLNNDVLNIIGRYVKRDNFKKQLSEEEQVLNGKKIIFPNFSKYYSLHDLYLDHKKYRNNFEAKIDLMISYIFEYIDKEMESLKSYSKFYKYKLNNADRRMAIWIFFQRIKIILKDDYVLNMEDENIYFNEYLKSKKLNLKSKKYSLNY